MFCDERDGVMAIASGPIEPAEAVSAINSGDTVMVRRFGLVGAPLTLIRSRRDSYAVCDTAICPRWATIVSLI